VTLFVSPWVRPTAGAGARTGAGADEIRHVPLVTINARGRVRIAHSLRGAGRTAAIGDFRILRRRSSIANHAARSLREFLLPPGLRRPLHEETCCSSDVGRIESPRKAYAVHSFPRIASAVRVAAVRCPALRRPFFLGELAHPSRPPRERSSAPASTSPPLRGSTRRRRPYFAQNGPPGCYEQHPRESPRRSPDTGSQAAVFFRHPP
jgi:hypothetical protein